MWLTLVLVLSVLDVLTLVSCKNEAHGFDFVHTGKEFVQFENFSCPRWECKNEPPPTHVDEDLYLIKMGCYCDDLCHSFDDCCDDYDKTKIKHIHKSLSESIQCFHHCMVSKQSYFYAVTKCPSDYPNKEVSDLCNVTNTTDNLLKIPATGKTTGLMYKNIFCAQCHGEEAQIWQLNIICTGKEAFDVNETFNIADLLQRSDCDPRMINPPNASHLRPCVRNMIASCPSDAHQDLRMQCDNAGHKYVYTPNGVYKNLACAVCNKQTSPKCFGVREKPCTLSVMGMGFYSMSLLFDIGAGQRVRAISNMGHASFKEESEIGSLCTSLELYDPFIGDCRKITCGIGYTYTNGQCQAETQSAPSPVSNVFSNGTLRNCPRVTLNESEFRILEDGRLLEILSNVVHDPEDFNKVGQNAMVCALDHTNSSNTDRMFIVFSVPTFSSLEGIISATGMIISLIGLLGTVLVYIVFRSLRNVPGCNIMCLSIALFIAELMMLIAPSTERLPVVCKIFGIGTHYLFLVAFMWMNVIAVDAWSTFSRGFGNVRKRFTARRFTVYCLYAWMVPIIPVITAVLMDICLPLSPFAPSYGQDVCWIRNKLAVIAFFAAPLAFIILMNIILFTMTSATICSVKKSSARKLGREDRGEFLIYIKLFVVMGLTWVFGFLSAFVPHPVTTYLYIVVNSLQGLFIGISFVCTRKVLVLFRERFNGSRSEFTVTTEQQLSSINTHM